MPKDSFNPFICMSTRVVQSSVDMIEGIGALTALSRCEESILTRVQRESEMRDLRAALEKALGAVESYEACIAAGIETCTGEEFEKAGQPRRGGPTEKFPNAPYCKPDQSCCDFVCGN